LINQLFPALELAHIKVVIESFSFQEVLMPAALDNLPLVHHQDHISIADCAQAVCIHITGASLEQPFQRALDQDLSTGIDAGSGFV
jgi:hypothetical protein